MKNEEKFLKMARDALNEKLSEFTTLEKEKADIIARYKKASANEKPIIEKQMQESTKKYQTLEKEMKVLEQKIHTLTNTNK